MVPHRRGRSSLDEWPKRCPDPFPGTEAEVELRQVEAADFGAKLTPELREQEKRRRARDW